MFDDHLREAIALLDLSSRIEKENVSAQVASVALAHAAVAQAQSLQRIADVLETFRSEGVPVVDVSSESSVSLAETIAAQHDANLYR